MSKECLLLNDDLFITAGHHKKMYQHPSKKNHCLKMAYVFPDVDVPRELRYRKFLELRHKKLSMLPTFYGMVDTNLGPAMDFELIKNYDGSSCPTLMDVIHHAELTKDPKEIKQVIQYYEEFRDTWFQEKVMTTDVNPENFMLQFTSPTQYRFRIIDNIGDHAKLPLRFLFDNLALKHVKKYWLRLIRNLKTTHPTIFTEEVATSLLNYKK